MKKIFYLLSIAALFLQCAGQNNSNKMNYKEIDYKGHPMLVGEINENLLEQGSYKDWFDENYADYQGDPTVIQSFSKPLKEFTIKIFMGTWCGDSHREVPAFLHMLKEANFPMKQVKIFAVDRQKTTPEGYENGMNITHVPTFIFYKNGKEMGRIVESPIQSLEEDTSDIVKGQPQTPNYSE